jgi:hypothetical protein
MTCSTGTGVSSSRGPPSPELDFSVVESLDQFAAVIERDFEGKARPRPTSWAASSPARTDPRYDLLCDLALDLFWENRCALTMYVKRPPGRGTCLE